MRHLQKEVVDSSVACPLLPFKATSTLQSTFQTCGNIAVGCHFASLRCSQRLDKVLRIQALQWPRPACCIVWQKEFEPPAAEAFAIAVPTRHCLYVQASCPTCWNCAVEEDLHGDLGSIHPPCRSSTRIRRFLLFVTSHCSLRRIVHAVSSILAFHWVRGRRTRRRRLENLVLPGMQRLSNAKFYKSLP